MKLEHIFVLLPARLVAPLVGAWIEICLFLLSVYLFLSLPSWERGLKFVSCNTVPTSYRSLPSWERGLKLRHNHLFSYLLFVAPLVGAWIEIENNKTKIYSATVAPLVGAWIEIDGTKTESVNKVSRSPRGSVD